MTATLYQVKPWFQSVLRPGVATLAGLGARPNHLTAAAVAVSICAGLLVGVGGKQHAWLWLVPLMYLARMALNAADGLLAREHGMETRGGAVFNEIADVVSDAAAYLPFALVFPAQAAVIVVVVVLALIGEVAALAASESGERRNDGPLGKSDRALVIGAIALVASFGLDEAAWAFWTLIPLGALTIVNRVGR